VELADGGLGERFAEFELAAGDRVEVVVGATDHQQAFVPVEHECAHGDGDAVGLWCVGVVEVVHACHEAP
jgi:hypothetical protein